MTPTPNQLILRAPLRTVMVVFGAHAWGALDAPFEGGVEV